MMGCVVSRITNVECQTTTIEHNNDTTEDYSVNTVTKNNNVIVSLVTTNNNEHTNEEIKEENTFMQSIDTFIESHNDPNSFVNQIQDACNVDKSEYNKQLKTFRDDIKLMCEGKMDYATMRSLYG